MKKLKYLLFILPLLFIENVFALEYDVTSSITSPQGQGRIGTYTGLEIYNSGSNNVYNVNTRYNGQLSQIVYNIPLPDNWEDGSCFSTNVDYTVAMYMSTDDWRNNFSTVTVKNSLSPSSNWSNGNVTFVSMKKIYFTFKIPTSESGSCYDSFLVTLKSNNISTQAFTGVSNWNLSKVTITDPTTSSGGGSSGGGSSGSTNQDIINNNNNNTSDIIENNNQNTQDIIKSIDDNFKSCSLGSNLFTKTNINNGYYLNSSGVITSTSGWFVTDYISVTPNTTYEISGTTTTGGSNLNLCFYTSSKSLISCIPHNDYLPPKQITTPNNAYYFADSVYSSDINTYSFKKLNCSNKLDELREQQNQNTQDIINNQNSNTQQQIESQKVCNFIDKVSIIENHKVLEYNTGNTENATKWGVTNYYKIDKNTEIKLLKKITQNFQANMCFYNINKNFLTCLKQQDLTENQIISIPNNANYVRFSINNDLNEPQWNICQNGNQAIQDSLTDSNVDNGTGTDFFDDFTSQDFGLSQIVTIPLNTIQSLTSKTCSPLQIPIPFTNSNVTLPCMTELYETKFPTIYNLWKIVSFGIIAYLISIDIFHIVKGFKDPESDKVEVLDL